MEASYFISQYVMKATVSKIDMQNVCSCVLTDRVLNHCIRSHAMTWIFVQTSSYTTKESRTTGQLLYTNEGIDQSIGDA